MSMPKFTAERSLLSPNGSYRGKAPDTGLPAVSILDDDCILSGGLNTFYCLNCFCSQSDCVLP